MEGLTETTSQLDSETPESNEVGQEYVDDVEATEIDGDEQLSDDNQADEPIDDSEEIEFNQKQYKLPKDIAVAVKDMQKDYTVKTQAVADQRKQFEAQVQFQQQHIQEFAKVVALNDQLAEFEKVDWNALSQEDPIKAQQLFFHKSSLESQRNQLAQSISQKNQQVALEEQQSHAKLLEESESVLKRDIKDWSPDYENKLMQFGHDSYGISKDDFKRSKLNPMTMKLLNDAYLGKQIIQKQIAKPKIVPKAEPATTISGRAAKSTKAPSEMSQAEYSKWRQQGYK